MKRNWAGGGVIWKARVRQSWFATQLWKDKNGKCWTWWHQDCRGGRVSDTGVRHREGQVTGAEWHEVVKYGLQFGWKPFHFLSPSVSDYSQDDASPDKGQEDLSLEKLKHPKEKTYRYWQLGIPQQKLVQLVHCPSTSLQLCLPWELPISIWVLHPPIETDTQGSSEGKEC